MVSAVGSVASRHQGEWLVGIGSAEEEVIVHVAPSIALSQAKGALSAIGRVLEADDAAFFVRGSTRYGLQKVRIKCQILPRGESSRIVIKALADDVWGKGARVGIKKMKDALGGNC